MKHFLHIGLGTLYNLYNLVEENRDFQLRYTLPLKDDPDWKIWSCDCKYYTESELQIIQESDWIEEFVNESICVDWSGVPLFDRWDCISVMEHVKANEAELFVTKLRSKVTDNSKGYVHIDLSDHYGNRFDSTEKFKDGEWAVSYYEKKDKRYNMYLNRVSGQEWIDHFSKCFEFEIDTNTSIALTLMNVKPKSNV